mmetsp:Transcript_12113/g.21443  ORF Transcript_12113/g.21443 Transcript_12113/m.21443 type:complete len:245 (-) Transcript_12113:601-1335(-)
MAEAQACEVLPPDLRFRFALNKQLLATITINNPLSARVAFKIKTTAPKKYVVRPSSGVVDAHGSVSVQVIMQAQKEYPADFANCKDKFMVQTTALGDQEQLDKDTFLKETRKDMREARLRVILEGPAAPPSPVPEANEHDADTADHPRAAVSNLGAATVAGETSRARGPEPSAVSSENTSLKVQLDGLLKERDELRRKLDYLELQGGGTDKGAAGSVDQALKFRVSIVHIILVAIIAFLVGHYT